ncbi:MAG: beta strand repeat-containing protein, partial [Planctomycetota bacterium]
GGSEYTVFEAQFKVLSPGEFTISTNIGEATQSQPLFFDATTVPQINFGSLPVVAVRAVTAADDTASVAEDSLASSATNRINVMLNDTLNAGGSKRIVSFTNGANGAVTLFTNGTSTNLADDQLIYAPNANFAGTDTFTYVFGDGNGNTATATVTVTVTPVNDAPVNTVPSGSQSTNEDVVKTFSTANSNAFSVTDIDAGSGVIQVTFTSTNATLALADAAGVTAAGNGASATPLVISGTVANINTALGLGLNFTPAANFSGSGTIVMVTTAQGNTGSGGAKTDTDTVTITISAVNDAPVNTLPTTIATDEGVAFTITGLSIADVDAGTAQVRTTLSVTANTGVLQLLSTNGVTVATNGSSSVQITGTLAAINTALNGGVRFTPATGFAGDTQFTMVTTDQGNTGSGGAQTDTDTVTLQVRPLVRPRASGDSLTVAEDSSADNLSNQLNVLTNDVANPGATLILKSFTQPMNGSVSTGTVTRAGDTLKFAPAADFAGSTTFTYTINDSAGTGLDSTATVSVTVTAINDAPVAGVDSVSVAEDTVGTFTAVSLLANDSKGGGADEAAQTLTITAATVVSGGGGVQVVNGNVVYTPVANYAGPATLTYTIRDNGQTNGATDFQEATGTINVTVTEVNDAPAAVNDSGFTVAEDSGPLLIPLANLIANDSRGGGADESTQTLTITSVNGVTANAGSVSINGVNVQYSPSADYNGSFLFTYVVTDNGTTNGVLDAKTATGTVTITVTEVNDAPTATDDTVIGVLATPSKYRSIQLTANDLRGPSNEFGQALKVTAVSPTSANGGTVSVDADGLVTYTPATGAITGTSDTFTYTVSDNGTTNGQNDFKTDDGMVTVNIVNFIPMTVSGFVYLDFDNDGAKDAGEVGMGHIDITLTGTDFGGVAITPQTVITNREGYYEFTNLAPGDYAITQGQASNAVDGKETAGSSRLTSTTNDRFTMNISLNDNVQLQNPVFANNNFAERGLSSNDVSIHLL